MTTKPRSGYKTFICGQVLDCARCKREYIGMPSGCMCDDCEDELENMTEEELKETTKK